MRTIVPLPPTPGTSAQQCEDLEDLPSLHQLHAVVKGMILLGDTTLLEVLFTGDNFEDVVGALEYEPGRSQKCR